MTREEAIKILTEIRDEASESESAVCYVASEEDIEAIDMAIEALQDDWIPVSERLPEDGYWLWSAVGGEVKKDFYWKGHWEQAEELGYEVTAWKPLPKPYRESEE